MRLSNPRKIVYLAVLFAGLSLSCGSSQANVNTAVNVTAVTEKRFPFPLREPDAYQADVVLTTNGIEEKYFVARKGDKWRFDIYRGSDLSQSQVRSGDLFLIEHASKTYTQTASATDASSPTLVDDATKRFFEGRDRYEFEEAGREGNIIKYRAHGPAGEGDALIYFDTTAGMITRQEFLDSEGKPNFVYELRNLKMEVDDAVFALPAGYKKTK